MQNKKMQNMERIKTIIASGLEGHQREGDIAKFYEAAESLVKSFEQSTKLAVEDEGVYVNKVELELSSGEPENNVSIAYSRRHVGLFPFPHDHCTVKLCWEAEVNGKRVIMCIEIEYPCNIDWPVIGRL